jgi:2-polyprenyl-3-methyl-5-hydroxy-6-metoxy-1,4-benzoquinol methylase
MVDIIENETQIELAAKMAQAINNDLLINLTGKKVLDVGSGLGHKSHEMSKLGADVYVVEPNSKQLEWSIQNGFVSRERAFNC